MSQTAISVSVVRDDPYVDANTRRKVCRWLHTLGALGWPVVYVGKACGDSGYITQKIRFGLITHEFAKRVHEFYEDHRDQHPTPREGLTAAQIGGARWYARKLGWSTPDWYNEADGRLLSVREHRTRAIIAGKYDRASKAIEVLVMIVNNMTDEQIAERIGGTVSTGAYWRRRAGIRGYLTGAGAWLPYPECRARMKEVERGLDRFLADPDADPHVHLCSLGIISDRGLAQHLIDTGAVPADTTANKIAS